jgi:serpin (serine protease inhibitor)
MTVQGQQDIPLATGSGWRATELRYVGAEGSTPLAMTLIVPDDLSAFEGRFSASTLDQIVGKLDAERARQAKVDESAPEGCGTYPYAVKVFLPRFGIETKGNLAHVLRALGMRSAFDGAAADFSGIVDPARSGEAGLFIKAVIHQANIDVDEKGTEAAAATAIGFDTGGCTGPDPAKVVTIRLDRPFLFAVRDLETGAILFLGRVLDPSAPR